MASVYIVQHSYQREGSDDEVKFIGVYSTRLRAEAAVAKMRSLPGFKDWPDGFYIDEYAVDEDNWSEGFIGSHNT